MGKVYGPGEHYEAGEYPAALAIGDSWFWYPNNNILGTLTRHRLMNADHSRVQNVGFNGALLQDYVGAGRHSRSVQHYLSPNFSRGWSEFYISGAGNDVIAYGLALKGNCVGITDPKACLHEGRMNDLLRALSTSLGSLIHDIRWAYRKDPSASHPVFLNGYDYPIPDGRGFGGGKGWLAPAMDAAGVDGDIEFRKQVARELIDQLTDEVFKAFHSPSNLVIHIDSRGTLPTSAQEYGNYWTNEMHPTNLGFKTIIERQWLPALAQYGIARQ